MRLSKCKVQKNAQVNEKCKSASKMHRLRWIWNVVSSKRVFHFSAFSYFFVAYFNTCDLIIECINLYFRLPLIGIHLRGKHSMNNWWMQLCFRAYIFISAHTLKVNFFLKIEYWSINVWFTMSMFIFFSLERWHCKNVKYIFPLGSIYA